jgi:ParB family chromosome partitioning protein
MNKVNSIYSRNKQSGIGALLNKSEGASDGSSFSLPSVVDGNVIEFEVKAIPSHEIPDKCYLSLYNSRSYSKLTKAAVSDIFDSIYSQKRNVILAIAAQNGKRIEVLTGGRRMYCVEHIVDAKFYVLVAKEISEADKKFLANASDTYEAPSILDVGFKILENQAKRKAEELKPYTYSELSELLTISVGKAQEAVTFASYPSYILNGFPGLRFISYQWLRKIKKYQDRFEEHSEEIKALYEDGADITSIDEAKKYSDKLKRNIETILKPPAEAPLNDVPWEDIKPIKGVEVVSKDSELTIKIDTNKVSDVQLQKIQKILSS